MIIKKVITVLKYNSHPKFNFKPKRLGNFDRVLPKYYIPNSEILLFLKKK